MLNTTALIGRLTADPKLTYTPNNVAVAKFTLAVQENYAGADGRKRTDFLQCTAYRKTAELISQYGHKGTLMNVLGRLSAQKYADKTTGEVKYWTGVIVSEFHVLEKRAAQTPDGKMPDEVYYPEAADREVADYSDPRDDYDPFS
ncbi:single-stranded DNA-binding protein [Pseudolactococcus yaeyamensis]